MLGERYYVKVCAERLGGYCGLLARRTHKSVLLEGHGWLVLLLSLGLHACMLRRLLFLLETARLRRPIRTLVGHVKDTNGFWDLNVIVSLGLWSLGERQVKHFLCSDCTGAPAACAILLDKVGSCRQRS